MSKNDSTFVLYIVMSCVITNYNFCYSLLMILFSCASENFDLQRRHQSVHYSQDHEYPKNTEISLIVVDSVHIHKK